MNIELLREEIVRLLMSTTDHGLLVCILVMLATRDRQKLN